MKNDLYGMIGIVTSIFVFGCSSAVIASSNPEIDPAAFDAIARSQYEVKKMLASGDSPYEVRVHAPEVASQIRDRYDSVELARLRSFFRPITSIRVNSDGLVQAADRPESGEEDSTHYDAIWVRDSLWAYLALSGDRATRADGTRVLKKMLAYLASDAQRARMAAVIQDPRVLDGPDGAMSAIHIRFDGRSPVFADVHVNGQPERWNHKQNDAVGLLFDLALRALETGEIAQSELTPSEWEALASLPTYFSRIRFDEMADAGPWEEIDRVNSSSIGLVTSSLEQLQRLMTGRHPRSVAVAQKLRAAAARVGRSDGLTAEFIARLVDQGYARVFKQLDAGGESPLYSPSDIRYRTADAALLNLIYPARLSRLTLKRKRSVLQLVEPLIGEAGIRRYARDSYQGGNFWLLPPATDTGPTGDASAEDQFKRRAEQLIPGTEAQWFFDSWVSVAAGEIYRESKNPGDRKLQLKHFNRALGQITSPVLGADGKAVPKLALPESYNTIVSADRRVFAPSPITPLNWAKACLTLAERSLSRR